jgi:hypothetical protein
VPHWYPFPHAFQAIFVAGLGAAGAAPAAASAGAASTATAIVVRASATTRRVRGDTLRRVPAARAPLRSGNMVDFLSTDWLAAARAAVRAPALDVRLQVTVTGAPGGDIVWHAVCVDGALVDLGVGPAADAEVALTLPYTDAIAVQRGELDPSVAYMQGRMKTAGDPGKLLDLLAVAARPAFAALRAELEAVTSF